MSVKDIIAAHSPLLTAVKAGPVVQCFYKTTGLLKWGRSDDLQHDTGELEHARKCFQAAEICA